MRLPADNARAKGVSVAAIARATEARSVSHVPVWVRSNASLVWVRALTACRATLVICVTDKATGNACLAVAGVWRIVSLAVDWDFGCVINVEV